MATPYYIEQTTDGINREGNEKVEVAWETIAGCNHESMSGLRPGRQAMNGEMR